MVVPSFMGNSLFLRGKLPGYVVGSSQSRGTGRSGTMEEVKQLIYELKDMTRVEVKKNAKLWLE